MKVIKFLTKINQTIRKIKNTKNIQNQTQHYKHQTKTDFKQ
jgi:hypothetical protein